MAGNDERVRNMLGIDTSTSALTIAITEQGHVRASERSDAERNHSIKLVPAIQEMLQKHGWTKEQVNGIAVGIGPGSYTGIRIAVTAAKTIAWAWGTPIAGVSSVEALAWSGLAAACRSQLLAEAAGSRYLICPMMDARRGQVFTGRFAGQLAELNDSLLLEAWSKPVIPEQLCDREQADGIRLFADVAAELEAELEQNKQLIVLLVGETAQQEERIQEMKERYGARVIPLSCEMDAAWIARLGEAALAAGQAADVHHIEPNYTQLAEAEVKLNAKEKAAKSNQ